jgi:hypothetical protein
VRSSPSTTPGNKPSRRGVSAIVLGLLLATAACRSPKNAGPARTPNACEMARLETRSGCQRVVAQCTAGDSVATCLDAMRQWNEVPGTQREWECERAIERRLERATTEDVPVLLAALERGGRQAWRVLYAVLPRLDDRVIDALAESPAPAAATALALASATPLMNHARSLYLARPDHREQAFRALRALDENVCATAFAEECTGPLGKGADLRELAGIPAAERESERLVASLTPDSDWWDVCDAAKQIRRKDEAGRRVLARLAFATRSPTARTCALRGSERTQDAANRDVRHVSPHGCPDRGPWRAPRGGEWWTAPNSELEGGELRPEVVPGSLGYCVEAELPSTVVIGRSRVSADSEGLLLSRVGALTRVLAPSFPVSGRIRRVRQMDDRHAYVPPRGVRMRRSHLYGRPRLDEPGPAVGRRSRAVSLGVGHGDRANGPYRALARRVPMVVRGPRRSRAGNREWFPSRDGRGPPGFR